MKGGRSDQGRAKYAPPARHSQRSFVGLEVMGFNPIELQRRHRLRSDHSVARRRAAAQTSALDATVRCHNGAVVCVSRPASQIGLQTLQRGGNAVDAAVATAFALAVTYPAAGNIGGGGYMLVVPSGDGADSRRLRFSRNRASRRDARYVRRRSTPALRIGASAFPARCAAWRWRIGGLAGWRGEIWCFRRVAGPGRLRARRGRGQRL